MKLRINSIGLLPRIIIAILAGIICALFFPIWSVRIFVTINGIFGNFLDFIIPLIILGLVAPGIAEMGKNAGRLLGITALIAYGSTLFSGFMTYFSCQWAFTNLLQIQSSGPMELTSIQSGILPYFTVEMPPVIGVMSALLLAFVLGLGVSISSGNTIKQGFSEFREVIMKLISAVIIPFLPIYIFGIFLKMGAEGQVADILTLFIKVIAVIFVLHILLLLLQYTAAGIIARKNPFRLLKNMLPAYMTALGTQSSAATIPVTLNQTRKNGVSEELAGFVIPLCATIHLAGSIMKITACAMAIMYMNDMPVSLNLFIGFIFMLGITMVAAPGVPGGAIMAALGLLSSMLGFDETLQALMIALYIAMDSFGTACNVTGDGALAVIIDRIDHKKRA